MQHRIANCLFELEARLQLGIHLRAEEPDAIATLGLAPVQRQIRTFQKPFRIVSVLGRQRNADAHRGNDRLLPERIGAVTAEVRRRAKSSA